VKENSTPTDKFADTSTGLRQAQPDSSVQSLRQQAEEVLRRQPEELREMPPEDIQHLIHELEVHQVELELQNEELRRIQRELELSRDRYSDLYDFAPVGYFTVSEAGLILEANLTTATMLGVERGYLIKQPLTRFIASEDQDTYYLHRRQLFETQEPRVCEMRMVRGDSTQFWARMEATVAQGGKGDAVVFRATMSDVTARKQAEEALRALLLVDELTGLYNRRGFETLAAQQLKTGERAKRGMLLLFADFDHLKWINDTLGHPEGDRALIKVADALKETFRASDILARIGGDEFVVLAIDTDSANPEVLTARLQENLEARNAKGDHHYRLSLSVGVARYDPEHPCSIDELLARADRAMYEQRRDEQQS
jgi:diguanylate cyclase (GGDEF)-like protein/PAS domain S-box-containing protein